MTNKNKFVSSGWMTSSNNWLISEIDLNLDGIMDLIVFDKSGNKKDKKASIYKVFF